MQHDTRRDPHEDLQEQLEIGLREVVAKLQTLHTLSRGTRIAPSIKALRAQAESVSRTLDDGPPLLSQPPRAPFGTHMTPPALLPSLGTPSSSTDSIPVAVPVSGSTSARRGIVSSTYHDHTSGGLLAPIVGDTQLRQAPASSRNQGRISDWELKRRERELEVENLRKAREQREAQLKAAQELRAERIREARRAQKLLILKQKQEPAPSSDQVTDMNQAAPTTQPNLPASEIATNSQSPASTSDSTPVSEMNSPMQSEKDTAIESPTAAFSSTTKTSEVTPNSTLSSTGLSKTKTLEGGTGEIRVKPVMSVLAMLDSEPDDVTPRASATESAQPEKLVTQPEEHISISEAKPKHGQDAAATPISNHNSLNSSAETSRVTTSSADEVPLETKQPNEPVGHAAADEKAQKDAEKIGKKSEKLKERKSVLMDQPIDLKKEDKEVDSKALATGAEGKKVTEENVQKPDAKQEQDKKPVVLQDQSDTKSEKLGDNSSEASAETPKPEETPAKTEVVNVTSSGSSQSPQRVRRSSLKSSVSIQVSARNLPRADFFSKSDPRVVVRAPNVRPSHSVPTNPDNSDTSQPVPIVPNSSEALLWQMDIAATETIANNHNPDFAKRLVLPYLDGAPNAYAFAVFDEDESVELKNEQVLVTSQDLLGFVVVRLDVLKQASVALTPTQQAALPAPYVYHDETRGVIVPLYDKKSLKPLSDGAHLILSIAPSQPTAKAISKDSISPQSVVGSSPPTAVSVPEHPETKSTTELPKAAATASPAEAPSLTTLTSEDVKLTTEITSSQPTVNGVATSESSESLETAIQAEKLPAPSKPTSSKSLNAQSGMNSPATRRNSTSVPIASNPTKSTPARNSGSTTNPASPRSSAPKSTQAATSGTSAVPPASNPASPRGSVRSSTSSPVIARTGSVSSQSPSTSARRVSKPL